jgi:ribosomal protein S18 acetylase RimI-like enzyme
MTALDPGLDVRPLTKDHLPTVTELYCAVFNAAPWNDAWTIETASARLRDTLATPGADGLLALAGGQPAGCLLGYREQWFDGVHFYLKEMFVHPDLQHRGMGTMLMEQLKDSMRRQGVARIYLLTERGGAAADFYRARGFYESRRMTMMGCNLPVNDSMPS